MVGYMYSYLGGGVLIRHEYGLALLFSLHIWASLAGMIDLKGSMAQKEMFIFH